ncbi:MAG: DUF4190 domain-containing protein [Planctomycetales bacterium]|nr:DUF4190 domain-containing protein [Planctomycetales bacterium]
MTTADMDKMGFTHEEDNELVEYRSLSRWALAAAVFGVFSATALATPLLWVVPLVALAIGGVALSRINANPQLLTGRGWAIAGMMLAVFFGAWGVTRPTTRQQVLINQARDHAQQVIDLLQQQEGLKLYLLTQDRSLRPEKEADIEKFTEGNADRQSELKSFLEMAPIDALLSSGDEGTYQFVSGTVPPKGTFGQEVILLYDFADRRGMETNAMEIEIALRRSYDEKTGEATWQLRSIRTAPARS